jgi:RNA polymerase primary sigma factor
MKAMASRLTLLAEARTKYFALAALKQTVDQSHGTLVFTQTQESARRAEQVYTALGSRASALYSGMAKDDRKQGMEDFRSGASQILAAPRLLDEGIDVPEADLGIIVAANRSQRQMVQRLGRVIRKKADGRWAASWFSTPRAPLRILTCRARSSSARCCPSPARSTSST